PLGRSGRAERQQGGDVRPPALLDRALARAPRGSARPPARAPRRSPDAGGGDPRARRSPSRSRAQHRGRPATTRGAPGRGAAADAALARLGGLTGPDRQAWEAAVRDELVMACTEHVRSVDPRYLDHPEYDLEYTLTARRLLEARLLAAAKLGIAPDHALLRGV